MNLTVGQFIVWLIVGSLAGTLTGRLVTFRKEGLGRWTNLGVGMVGALIGGLHLLQPAPVEVAFYELLKQALREHGPLARKGPQHGVFHR
jgi:uncharacterized membrane protein YeaQ/YmgE (transglycosylase-associated protein family)